MSVSFETKKNTTYLCRKELAYFCYNGCTDKDFFGVINPYLCHEVVHFCKW